MTLKQRLISSQIGVPSASGAYDKALSLISEDIEALLPEEKIVDPIGDPFYLEYQGYNMAIEDIKQQLTNYLRSES